MYLHWYWIVVCQGGGVHAAMVWFACGCRVVAASQASLFARLQGQQAFHLNRVCPGNCPVQAGTMEHKRSYHFGAEAGVVDLLFVGGGVLRPSHVWHAALQKKCWVAVILATSMLQGDAFSSPCELPGVALLLSLTTGV